LEERGKNAAVPMWLALELVEVEAEADASCCWCCGARDAPTGALITRFIMWLLKSGGSIRRE